jgi:hypothetical protein
MGEADKKLEEAREQIKREQEIADAERQAEAARLRERQVQFSVGLEQLKELRWLLISKLEGVPNTSNRGTTYKAGSATLVFGDPAHGGSPSIAPGWNVFAWSPIEVSCRPATGRSYTWSGTILFVDRNDGEGPRLWEVGFFAPLSTNTRDAPYGLDPREREFTIAVSPVMGTSSFAFEPKLLSGESPQTDFLERWSSRFADAMLGSLSAPSSLPLTN